MHTPETTGLESKGTAELGYSPLFSAQIWLSQDTGHIQSCSSSFVYLETVCKMCLGSNLRGHFSITSSRRTASTRLAPHESTEHRSVPFQSMLHLGKACSYKFGNNLSSRLSLTLRSHWLSPRCWLSHDQECYLPQHSNVQNYTISLIKSGY